MKGYFGKRALDVGLSWSALFVFSPLMTVLVLATKYLIGTPVFFKQMRPGMKGVPFRLYKFRSMTDLRDATGRQLPDSERMTAYGKLLRSTSLDELPELFNVIQGQMSLVGPRPLLMQYLGRYSARQMRRHDVKPGITGWAQVNGRNALSWKEKFRLDVWYVDNQSFSLDIRIICLTVKQVLKRQGIRQPGQETAAEFMGDENGND